MKKRRRILLLSYCLDYGGSERQLTEIARSMDPEIYEVHVGCLKGGGLREPELRAAGIPVVTFPMKSFFSVAALYQSMRLVAYIRRHQIDLVHAFDVPMDIFGAPAAKLSLRPLVLTSQRAHRGLTSGVRLRMLRASDHITDGIVVNCDFIRRHLMEDERVDGKRIYLCYNGLDELSFAYRERADGWVIGCVCALREEKNLELLVDAFALVRQTYPACRLLLVGSGPGETALKDQVARKQLQEVVTFVPANADVPKWMDQIDLFVLPSRSEAFSNSLMEAMACGCAVIASNVGGNPELVGDEERGLLFQEGNVDQLCERIVRLLRDPGLRTKNARAARAFVEAHLTIRASVARMTEIYETFLR